MYAVEDARMRWFRFMLAIALLSLALVAPRTVMACPA
jgi:hypothetical protein